MTDAESTGAPWAALSLRLRRIALGLTRRAADADDLVQQTFAAVLARRPERADHLGFLRRVLVRTWLDEQRSLRRRMARWWRAALTASAADQAAAGVEGDELRRLHDAIEQLPARQHAVLVLRLSEELEFEEIAELLGISIENARSTLHAARAAVRAALGEV